MVFVLRDRYEFKVEVQHQKPDKGFYQRPERERYRPLPSRLRISRARPWRSNQD
jgi:hypothetical protein